MKIAVVGGYGVGLTMRLDRAPEAGETVSGGMLSIGPGGKGSNQAIGAARLGASVSLFTALGPDAAAASARALWATEGVNASGVVDKPAATMTGFITVDSRGENRIAIAPGALSELVPSDLDGFRSAIASADLLIVSLEIPADVAVLALRFARAAGTATLLNPAPATLLPDHIWHSIDVLTPNRSEAARLTGLAPNESPRILASALRQRCGGSVVLTLGEEGALIADALGTDLVRVSFPAQAIDTTGAGDAFTAALAVGLAGGLPIRDAVREAVAAGAYAVTMREVVPALATRDQLDAILSIHRRSGGEQRA